ncbi:c-type cytochrome [Campylobacter sp.]|uniref:c-type cytochrome n=1 Tax=Campylobacter sp. TaxID=205 RepID=UPI0026DC8673|nr:c-type cytochrome [Campylobacter sp.]MDO4673706.1 c-type cytochrome [Campylobacter sp.]
MKVLPLILTTPLCAFGADFITQKEYAKMLYENPRGISCKHCHGSRGEEQILGHYTLNGQKTAYKVPSIQNLDYVRFKNALERPSKSFMPSYSLTDEEIKSLYHYIQQFSRSKNDQ